MTILAGRWDIDYVAKRVFRVVATQPTVTDTTLALYSALQDEFDEPAQMDNQVPMSAQTPTAFTMINGWFIDDVSVQFLTGGALQTAGWTGNIIATISYDATGAGTAFGASDIGLVITGTTTGDTGVILGFDERYGTELGVLYIRPDVPASDLFDNATEAYTVATSSAAGIFSTTFQGGMAQSGEALWPNVFALGTLFAETELYVIQDEAKITQWWPKGFFDVLIRTTEAGFEIDDGEIMVGARQYGVLFDHFVIDLTAGGRQPVPLSTGNDLNNESGHREMVLTDAASGPLVVGEIIEDDSEPTLRRGLVTSVSGTEPNLTIQYHVLGDLSDFTGATGTLTGVTSGGTATAVAPTDVNAANLTTDPTLVVGATTASLGAGEPTAPYSLAWDTNQNTMADFYEFLKLLVKRGAGTGGAVEIAFTAQAGTETITGEAYIGNALQAEYNTQTGAFVEGEILYFHDVSDVLQAQGVVVADHDDGATGDLIMRNMRFFGSNTITQVGDNVVQASYTDFATVASTRSIAPVKPAPFGTLAGGVFFGAPGVLITDILAADAQNFQLVDDDGNVRTPPVTVQVTVTGTATDDRVAVFVLDQPLGSGGLIVKTQFTLTAAAGTENGIGDSNLEIDATIPNDQPAAGFVRVVDASATDGREDRFQYDSFTGQIFTLTPLTFTGAQLADTQDLTGTLLIDADASFIANGAKVGMVCRNVTDGNGFGVITVVAAGQITMTPLTGGTGDTWEIGDAYEINTIPVDYTTSDDAYVPLIDDETGATSIVSGTMTYIADRDLVIRVRNGGVTSPIIPFETGATLGNTNLSVAAIRTADSIAT